MRSILRFYRKYRISILPVCCLLALLALSYSLTNYLVEPRYVVHAALDDRIPFCPAFVIFYLLWYLYIPALLVVGLKQGQPFFRRQVLTMCGGVLFCTVFFCFFPTSIDFRPTVDGPGFFRWVCRLIYAFDRPVNVFPSIHCHNALSLYLTTFCGTPLGKKRRSRAAVFLFCILICLSTVFIKQHSVLDGLAGCALAILFYFIFQLPIFRRYYDHKTL